MWLNALSQRWLLKMLSSTYLDILKANLAEWWIWQDASLLTKLPESSGDSARFDVLDLNTSFELWKCCLSFCWCSSSLFNANQTRLRSVYVCVSVLCYMFQWAKACIIGFMLITKWVVICHTAPVATLWHGSALCLQCKNTAQILPSKRIYPLN